MGILHYFQASMPQRKKNTTRNAVLCGGLLSIVETIENFGRRFSFKATHPFRTNAKKSNSK
jgi:hypothetical protein